MINTAMLLGRVGKKEVKQLKNGGEMTMLSIATTKKYKDSDGNQQEQTTWHNVNCFSKLSDIANKYVHVSDLVFVQGEIQNRKIESGERVGQYVYSLHANDIKFIPKGKAGESSNNSQTKQAAFTVPDDEIPF